MTVDRETGPVYAPLDEASAVLVPHPAPAKIFNPSVHVRAATAKDLPAIVDVFRSAFGPDALGGEAVIDHYLAWAYDDNPRRAPGVCSHKVGEIDGHLVAVTSRLHVIVRVRGQRVPATWGQNDAVRAEFQRMQVNSSMGNLVWSDALLTMGAGRSAAGKAKAKARAVQTFLDVTPFASRKLRLTDDLRVIVGRLRRADLRGALRHLRGALHRVFTPVRACPGVRVTQVSAFDGSVNDFLASLETSIPIMVERDSSTLNWFLANPRLRIRSFVARRESAVCGYALMREDGVILDLLVRPGDGDAFRSVLAALLEVCKASGLREISGIVPRIPGLARDYWRAGFVLEPGIDFMFGFQRIFMDEDTALARAENWYLSMADSDLWSFRLRE